MFVSPIRRLEAALCAITSGGKPEEVVALARRFDISGRAARDAARGKMVSASNYVRLCGAAGIDPMTGTECEPAQLSELDWHKVGIRVLLTLIGAPGRGCTERLPMRAAAKEWGLPLVVIGRLKAGQTACLENFITLCEALDCHPHMFLERPMPDVSLKHAPEHVDFAQVDNEATA